MSIKNDFISALASAQKGYSERREKIIRTMNNDIYTVAGKRQEVQKIVDEQKYVTGIFKEQVKKTVADKVHFLDAEEKDRLERRYADMSYRTALASSLDILKMCGDSVAPDDIREMLKMFFDDPMAIASIKKTVEEFAGKGGDALRYMDAIPADNRGKRQETLRKLENTMYDLLDGLTLEMPPHGLDEQGLQDTFTPRDIPAPVAINSTIDYMNRCNEDCTVFGGWG